ncbi:hypothetical protein SAMN04515674_10322 [Pseudarcicella hirudinis]|uniref:Uncharacterized protein n=1 Tax=Pseudarcicella hirudinis TaxID=1079859 RepID=A0A1I5Q5A5_9BACT|nr:hypothetical protein SAMN04515674_10322 [Pseudarcicella hirudinis]
MLLSSQSRLTILIEELVVRIKSNYEEPVPTSP